MAQRLLDCVFVCVDAGPVTDGDMMNLNQGALDAGFFTFAADQRAGKLCVMCTAALLHCNALLVLVTSSNYLRPCTADSQALPTLAHTMLQGLDKPTTRGNRSCYF